MPNLENKAPAALVEGSAAAFSAIAAAERGGQGPQDIQQRIRNVLERSKEIQQQQQQKLNEIADVLQNLGVAGGI
jgi:hypothetical protein